MYQLLNKKWTDYTNLAWEDFQKKQTTNSSKLAKKLRTRKNASKRIGLPKKLKIQILKRSNGLCEECGSNGKAIHHIKLVREFPELQHDINNLIFLCISCHRQKHLYLPEILFRI